ncbi:hypothetical protein AYO44_12730 [Planctomycetaceae bacterium SCGC AG-212-F19]|nr:hypothetical protein AYO44_12730 [Planctomycetaceae bacterium SCGC AG-212-F19]
MKEFIPEPSPNSAPARTFTRLRACLAHVVPAPAESISYSSHLATIIPPWSRRRVWQQLRTAGLALPALTLSGPVFILVVTVVMFPAWLIVLTVKGWTAIFSLAELVLLSHKVTRPLAIHSPIGCETVEEAVLQSTPFRHEDYRAGLWPPEDIASKVRLMVAKAAGVSFATITPQTRLCDLLD